MQVHINRNLYQTPTPITPLRVSWQRYHTWIWDGRLLYLGVCEFKRNISAIDLWTNHRQVCRAENEPIIPVIPTPLHTFAKCPRRLVACFPPIKHISKPVEKLQIPQTIDA